MNDDKTGVHLNEVLGRRSEETDTEIKVELNSAPLGQRCHLCRGSKWTFEIIGGIQRYIKPCPVCDGTGREALQELSGCPNIK
jgi:hypothetical protein